MRRWGRLFWKVVLWHFALTIGTGLLWNALISAVGKSHHAPAVVDATYAVFWLFVPFCQPFFWPLSDWIARSGYSTFFSSSWALELAEYVTIALVNSLSVVTLLFGAVGLLRFARSHPRKQTEI